MSSILNCEIHKHRAVFQKLSHWRKQDGCVAVETTNKLNTRRTV